MIGSVSLDIYKECVITDEQHIKLNYYISVICALLNCPNGREVQIQTHEPKVSKPVKRCCETRI